MCYNGKGDYMKISIIGLGEELGLPSLKNNKQNFQTRLLDAIEKKYKNEYEIEKINIFSYMFNKSWHLDSILKNNPTLNELERIRRIGNECAKRESFMMDVFSPKIEKTDYENKRIIDVIENKNVIIFDVGMNDFMYYTKNNVVAAHILLYKNKNANNVLRDENIFERVFNGVKSNIENILKINKNSSMYILGFSLKFYVPGFVYSLYDNKKLYNQLMPYINKWNSMLKNLENNNIHFINLDLYNSKEEAIKDIVPKIELGDTSDYNKLPTTDSGIDGIIKDFIEHPTNESMKETKYLKKIKET